MKKLLVLGVLSLAGLGIAAPNARACLLDCLNKWCCCNSCTTTLCMRPYNAFSPVCYGNICADGCMPLNLYGGCLPPMPQRPSCFGMGGCGMMPGCCPMQGCGMPGYGMPGMMPGYGMPGMMPGYGMPGMMPNCCCPPCCDMGCCTSGCCDMGCLPAPGSFANTTPGATPMQPGQPAPQGNPGPQFPAPQPQVVNPGMSSMPMQNYPGYNSVTPVGYYPGYQPMYNPYYPYAYPMNYNGQYPMPGYYGYGR